jgi:hypothetical protein
MRHGFAVYRNFKRLIKDALFIFSNGTVEQTAVSPSSDREKPPGFVPVAA